MVKAQHAGAAGRRLSPKAERRLAMLEAAWQTADPWHLSLTFRTARWAVMPHWFFDQASGTDLAMGLPPARTPTGPPRRGI